MGICAWCRIAPRCGYGEEASTYLGPTTSFTLCDERTDPGVYSPLIQICIACLALGVEVQTRDLVSGFEELTVER